MLARTRIRHYTAAAAALPPLPPPSEWRKSWAVGAPRVPHVALSNADTGMRLVNAFFPPAQEAPGARGKVVIEAFSGPGVLTRALLQLPPHRMRKLIVLEHTPKFHQYLKDLEAFDPRVKALMLDPYSWDSYNKLETEGILDDVEPQDWQGESELEFVATIPHTVPGEQLVAQLLRAIPEHSWLFKFGRMRMNLLIPEQLHKRIDAPVGKPKRCKLSVISEATSHFQCPIPPIALRPYDDHFWPPSFNSSARRPETRKRGHPMVAATFAPLAHQIIEPRMLDRWDYCLRRLFVLRTYELQKALPLLGPGASNLISQLHGPGVAPERLVDVRQRVSALDVKAWHNIVKTFEEWPFAPDMLFTQNVHGDEKHF